MDTLSFLQSIAGYSNAQNSSEKRVKLGTIDPTYVTASYPGTLPKITFDGESTLSGKTYPVVGNYLPAAGDRVALIPVGTTYAIIGALDSDASTRVGGELLVDGSEFNRGDWTYYAAAWTASSTDPTIVLDSRSKYRYKYLDNKTIQVQLFAYFDTGSSKGSGTWYVSVPVAAEDVYFSGMCGTFAFRDYGSAFITGAVTGDAGTNLKVRFLDNASSAFSTTHMNGTFVDSWIRADFTYRTA